MLIDILFLLSSIIAVALAVLMVIQKNPIYSALYLIGVFFPLAFIFLLLWAPFVAIMQILVYAGAIMVLFVFVIMMINLEQHELEVEKPGSFKFAAAISSVLFIGIAIFTIIKAVVPLSKHPVDIPESFGSITSIGHLIFEKYLIQFELISILILVAMIGAVVLAKKKLD